ncbi:MAG: bifunctional methylenetetrahydrofolate dehydrogenase/methenyltetrahydrofolate cyclohydrolase FolD [Verrucomicrobia bacterium]|nr:MAG: bifunctional methylenetetrahydrofolate dehydrogenase/methenyltetrahydrofolate cyclohydrolase FolD [Verrucomicrobiota bacterium]RPF86063.1 MAG: bifunctional methylenetetrahydrofolate dehydrogenase/methenyltetrahydrofolate cyclohydrolase FolD [Roseibacillus sp. TMED18]
MTILNGKEIAADALAGCREQVQDLEARGVTPGLAVVIVGKDPASHVYVGSKVKTCADLGIYSRRIELPEETSQKEVLEVVAGLNADPSIHGILVQSPPPPHINEEEIIRLIDPDKDVDGFHPVNVGKLVMEDDSGFVPCTPQGCIHLLERAGIETSGANAVVIGRSMIVGKPMALLLMGRGINATVTVAHSRTKELAQVCREADILIPAIGRPEFVTSDFVKEGAVVIDVGINRVEDSSRKRGYRLVGDVAYEEVAPKCRAITPVPGGVGPMTIAMLMSNTIKAARSSEGLGVVG